MIFICYLLNLIIADSALETIPENVFNHSSLRKIRNVKTKPSDILLDRTFHHFAILSANLVDAHKRGRPDILHIDLLCSMATPLYKKNGLKVFVHTINNGMIRIGESIRIPKSYNRFEGLMLDLFKSKKIISQDRKPLLEFSPVSSFSDIIYKYIKPDITVGFSTTGDFKPVDSIAEELSFYTNPCIVIGGFPKGYFSNDVDICLDKKYSIYPDGLESHVVISRILHEYEKIINY